VKKLRASRDNAAVERSLARLQEAARGDDNLMPSILDTVKSYATLGEICGELRTVFGEYRAPTVV
jgi:methylmalonyl-CoA mutase N-terminal domain/subunit